MHFHRIDHGWWEELSVSPNVQDLSKRIGGASLDER